MPARDAEAAQAAADGNCDRSIPVHRMRPGDHAFVSYDDDETRWEVLTAFTWLGLARGEKVIVLPPPGVPEYEVLDRLDAGSPAVAAARRRGQLVISSMAQLIAPDREFTAERQMSRLAEESARAVRDGYRALRAFIDMHWVAALGAAIAAMEHRETHAAHLFTGRPYSEICAYDRRAFTAETLRAMARAHPRTLMERLGSLRAGYPLPQLLHLSGEADAATRERFTAALREAVDRTSVHRRLTVDLTDLHFLSFGCAGDLLSIAHGATGHERITVLCDSYLSLTLRRLGADAVPHLTLAEGRPRC
ncbi:MEDS domain-containing protein [Streptomyces sp. LX-29]|uniref:MEDS domain-containing protein n=1 Tax=Streptomyces sp. LX-29 TaxID=2900152 RepID=UPI00240E4143|nr:MEDS domain-containing protein [Streptomyces sp. LX-29]WFB06387.1 MEDS domain-containing protein [Streptomyces sp. LX-29]